MFGATDGANVAGLNYIRIPIGASDFSANCKAVLWSSRSSYILRWAVYSLDDTSGDTSFSKFNINKIPSYVFSILKDIQSTNNLIKVHLVPWSPVSPVLSQYFFLLLMCHIAWMDEGQRYNEWRISSIAIRGLMYVLNNVDPSKYALISHVCHLRCYVST